VKERAYRVPLQAVDRWLLAVLCGFGAVALFDRALIVVGPFEPDEWLALALVPAVLGWFVAGWMLRGARSAAFVATCLYIAFDAALRRTLPPETTARPELFGLLIVSVFCGQAGRMARTRSEQERVSKALTDALNAGSPLPPGVDAERLRVIGVTSAALSEAGLLGVLVSLQRSREKQGWMNAFAFAGAVWLVGVATGIPLALWAGALALLLWLCALVARCTGLGTGRSPLDALVAGYFDRAVTGFLKTLTTSPADTLSRLGLAIGQLRLARYDDAVHEFLKARQFGFGELPLAVWLGVERELAMALRASGAAAQALATLERLHVIFPAHAGTLFEMATTLRQLGESRAAGRVLERAIRAGSAEAQDLLAVMNEEAGDGDNGRAPS
jgi:hypothetical protein